MPRAYWDWEEMLKANESGFYPYTPATNLLYALHEALQMIEEEGLQNIFKRHARYGEATRACVRAWGLDILCEEPLEQSNSLTAVMMPEGHNADSLGLTGEETFDFTGLTALNEGSTPKTVHVTATKADGAKVEFDAVVRIDTPGEADYYRHGGILQYVLRSLL